MKPRIRKNPGLISFPEEKKFTRSQSELISRQSREHISPAGELISARRADDKSHLPLQPSGVLSDDRLGLRELVALAFFAHTSPRPVFAPLGYAEACARYRELRE